MKFALAVMSVGTLASAEAYYGGYGYEVTDMARGLLSQLLKPMPSQRPLPLPTMAGEATEVTAMARGPLMPTTVATDMADTDTARGLLMPRLLPIMAGEAMEATAMARGLLTPKLLPTMVATDTEAMAMVRGLLMPRLLPTMAGEAT